MHELPGRKIVKFLAGRLPAEDRIAMRLATEAGDYLLMSTRLRRGVLQNLAQFRWRTSSELLAKCNGAVQMAELLGMSQWEEEEGLLPRRA